MKKKDVENQKYEDKMNYNLNMCIEEKIAPYWRDHQSLKGWTTMNYPTTL